MAYPTGLLSLTLENIDRQLIALKLYAQQHRNAAAAGNVESSRVLGLHKNLRRERAALSAAASTPGLAQFARDQKSNQSLDVVAEFNAVMAAIDGTISWVETNFPKDAGGFLLAQTITAGEVTDRMFTPAQTAGLRTQLDTLISTIA